MREQNLPLPLVNEWDWQLRGTCRREDPETFFYDYDQRGKSRAKRALAAKVICQECPVIAQCREFALSTEEPFGVWGGMTEEERRDYLRRNKRRKLGRRAAETI